MALTGLVKFPKVLLNLCSSYPFWNYIVSYRKRYLAGLLSLLVVDIINVLLPLLLRESIDALQAFDQARVVVAGAVYLLLMSLQSLGRYLWRIFLIGTSHLAAQKLRLEFYSHLQRLPLSYYHAVSSGDLMSRATNDIESVRMALGVGVLVSVDAICTFLLIMPVMIYLSPKLALISFLFYPLAPWITAKLGDKIDKLFEGLQEKMSALSGFVQESFQAIRLIKSLTLEGQRAKRFGLLSKQYESESRVLAVYQAVFSPSLSLITNLGTFLILLLGGFQVLEGLLTVGTFVAFQRFVVQLSWPMEAIGWAVTMNREGGSALRRIDQVLNVPAVSDISLVPEGPYASEKALEIVNLNFNRDHNASFSLLAEHLTVESGAWVGLVGPVGSGKSTLFDLILRLYEPPPGCIFFRGQDVRSIHLRELRSRIASVEQQIFLFSDSVMGNISMGISNNASFSEFQRVTEMAAIQAEISELTEGFGTLLGERGINLSGGQKQRLALARALFRVPSLLLLDDCFSSVDVRIENQIISNLRKERAGLTVVLASHRLNIMPYMDEIWVIERGRILARGSHLNLLEYSALYRSLWDKVSREGEVAFP